MAKTPQLVDQYGRPIERPVLVEEVAGPTITGVRSPIAGYPADGLNPRRLAQILREADGGDPLRYFELAETIEERDLHYAGVMQTRKRSIAQLEITVEAASDDADDVANADLVRAWLERDELADELFDMLDATGKGISLTEIIWDTSEGQWSPKRLEWRDPRWFTFDRVDGSTPLIRTDSGYEPLPAFKFISLAMKAKSGLPVRSGLSRIAAWAWMFKAFAQRDWAIFTQTFGQPIRLGKYGAGATEADKATLFRAVANIAGDCAAIVPQSMMIEFVQPPTLSGSAALYKERCDWLDQQMSKAVLGQTATTDAIAGGHAVGQEHRQVQEVIERADARAVAAVLNRDLVRPWIDLERGPQKDYPRIRIGRAERRDLKLVTESVLKLVPMGLRVQASDMRDMLGLADPDEGAELLVAPAAPPAATGADPEPQPMPALQAAEGQAGAREANLDEIIVAALDGWTGDMAGLIDPVRRAVAEASSFDDLVARLDGLLDDMDAGAIIERLAGAMSKARALGDVADG